MSEIGIPTVQIPKDKNKTKQLIEALKYQLTQDIREEDKVIHKQALKDLQESLKKEGN